MNSAKSRGSIFWIILISFIKRKRKVQWSQK